MTTPASAPLLTRDSAELARDYDRISADRQFQSGKNLVRMLAVVPGERVLDVGCGTGLLAEYIAHQVGASGYVLGIDPLPLRIALAQPKAHVTLEFRVGSAYELDDLPAQAFDAVCINAVFHWLPEKTVPLRAFARVLKPGGRLGISTGVKGYRSRMHEVVAEVLARPPYSDFARPAAGITYRVSEQEMHELLEAAGFSVALIETRDTMHHYATPEAAIRFSEASSFGNFLGHLPEAVRPAAREAIGRELAGMATAEGIRRDGRRLVAIATRIADRMR
jgi:ubiquinone/menaquinone biosynthesis C-methylase UbiE